MSRPSPIKRHADRHAIDVAIAHGWPARKIAREYAVSEFSVSRYRHKLQAEQPGYLQTIQKSAVDPAELARLYAETAAAIAALEQAKAHLSRINGKDFKNVHQSCP